jgi:hypothetical protein
VTAYDIGFKCLGAVMLALAWWSRAGGSERARWWTRPSAGDVYGFTSENVALGVLPGLGLILFAGSGYYSWLGPWGSLLLVALVAVGIVIGVLGVFVPVVLRPRWRRRELAGRSQ